MQCSRCRASIHAKTQTRCSPNFAGLNLVRVLMHTASTGCREQLTGAGGKLQGSVDGAQRSVYGAIVQVHGNWVRRDHQ